MVSVPFTRPPIWLSIAELNGLKGWSQALWVSSAALVASAASSLSISAILSAVSRAIAELFRGGQRVAVDRRHAGGGDRRRFGLKRGAGVGRPCVP